MNLKHFLAFSWLTSNTGNSKAGINCQFDDNQQYKQCHCPGADPGQFSDGGVRTNVHLHYLTVIVVQKVLFSLEKVWYCVSL